MYVGSASDSFNVRFRKHMITLSGNANAIEEYGLHNFVFIVLESEPGEATEERVNELIDVEN